MSATESWTCTSTLDLDVIGRAGRALSVLCKSLSFSSCTQSWQLTGCWLLPSSAAPLRLQRCWTPNPRVFLGRSPTLLPTRTPGVASGQESREGRESIPGEERGQGEHPWKTGRAPLESREDRESIPGEQGGQGEHPWKTGRASLESWEDRESIPGRQSLSVLSSPCSPNTGVVPAGSRPRSRWSSEAISGKDTLTNSS